MRRSERLTGLSVEVISAETGKPHRAQASEAGGGTFLARSPQAGSHQGKVFLIVSVCKRVFVMLNGVAQPARPPHFFAPPGPQS